MTLNVVCTSEGVLRTSDVTPTGTVLILAMSMKSVGMAKLAEASTVAVPSAPTTKLSSLAVPCPLLAANACCRAVWRAANAVVVGSVVIDRAAASSASCMSPLVSTADV